jgi:hypothetical protein
MLDQVVVMPLPDVLSIAKDPLKGQFDHFVVEVRRLQQDSAVNIERLDLWSPTLASSVLVLVLMTTNRSKVIYYLS